MKKVFAHFNKREGMRWLVVASLYSGFFLLVVLVLSGCYEKRAETTLGTIGRTAIETGVDTVSRALFEKSEAERRRMAERLAAEEVARQTAEAALALHEERLARHAEVERELRRELDSIKSDRETLREHLSTIARQADPADGPGDDCPLGGAAAIGTVVVWLRDRADSG